MTRSSLVRTLPSGVFRQLQDPSEAHATLEDFYCRLVARPSQVIILPQELGLPVPAGLSL